jgi:lipoprotein-anchoring transpeptidase ErfK/SrfK
MNPDQAAALQALEQARSAIQAGDQSAARQFAAQAAELAPELEEVWMVMASLAAPRIRVEYLKRALQINPDSLPAQTEMALALESLSKPAPPVNPPGPTRKPLLIAAVLALLLCLGAAALFASGLIPVRAFFGLATTVSTPPAATQPASATPAPTSTAAATLTPFPALPLSSPTAAFTSAPIVTATTTFAATLTATPTETSTPIPTASLAESASPTALPTDTLEPFPTQPAPQAQLPSASSGAAAKTGSDGVHWIDVDLTNQLVTAYEGQTVVNSFLVSTGATPRLTVTGSYHVYERHIKGNMWGPGYFLPDVPYIMYFFKGYALHGTYWHSNFGTPMSHGCVNLSIPDAEWLYSWSTLGTLVKVHY